MGVDGAHRLVEDMAGCPDQGPQGARVAQPQLLVVGVHHPHLW